MDEVSWHAGDGSMMGNGNTISIEICEPDDGNYAQAEVNAAYLTAQILFEYNLPKDAIKMHRDWSGKNCPHNMIEGTKGTMGWDAFVKLVGEIYDKLEEENDEVEEIVLPDSFKEYLSKTEYTYDQNLLYGIALETSVEEVVNAFKQADETAQITVTNSKEEVITTGIIATNDKIQVSLKDESFVFTVAIPFDLNGDGKFNALDYRAFTYYMLDKRQYPLSYASKASADVNHKVNEKIQVNALDYRQMTYAMLK